MSLNCRIAISSGISDKEWGLIDNHYYSFVTNSQSIVEQREAQKQYDLFGTSLVKFHKLKCGIIQIQFIDKVDKFIINNNQLIKL